MSMKWGLELRVPLVDRSLIECVGTIPSDRRLAAGKRLLVESVPEIPDWVVNQPKRGFRFPFESWLTSDWKQLFDELDWRIPANLITWYRKWTLVVLEHVLRRDGLSTALDESA